MTARKRRGEKTLADDLKPLDEKIDVWLNHRCDSLECNCREVIRSSAEFCERNGYGKATADALADIVAIFGARAVGYRKAPPKE